MARNKASRAIKLFGTETKNAKIRELKAGELSAILDNGAMRCIRFRGVEVLRGISFLVRDRNWGTYTQGIKNLKVKQATDCFTVNYEAICGDEHQAIRYVASIKAEASGSLVFSAVGTPLNDFVTNRTGFVVLHPLEGVAGRRVAVVHADGKREKNYFPKFISPGQPIFNIRSLKHAVLPGVTATVVMEGGKFEMEDHRNWMDASYKTYVRSLFDPWPYTLEKGELFTQVIALKIESKVRQFIARKSSNSIQVVIGAARGRLPVIGTGIPMQQAQAALEHSSLIASARPAYLVCQIDGRKPSQVAAARAFAELKRAVCAPVTLEVILPALAPAKQEMEAVAASIREGGLEPDTIVVTQAHDLKSFQPDAKRPWGPEYEEMAMSAKVSFPGVPVGGGMLSYFTELNRKPVPRGVFDFITHTVCPIVHAADDRSVMETLEALPWIFASTRNMIGKSPYHIGPVSIPCRDNPYAESVAANPNNDRVCLAEMDPRQRGLFAAVWTLGVLAAATRHQIDAVAIGAATGPQGAVYRKSDYPQPWFDQANAKVYPVYHVLKGLAGLSGSRTLDVTSSEPSKIGALAVSAKHNRIVWLYNLTDEAQTLKLSGLGDGGDFHVLSDSTFETLARQPEFLLRKGKPMKRAKTLELAPYAIMRTSGEHPKTK